MKAYRPLFYSLLTLVLVELYLFGEAHGCQEELVRQANRERPFEIEQRYQTIMFLLKILNVVGPIILFIIWRRLFGRARQPTAC